MNTFIKQFIEENIEAIESSDWKTVLANFDEDLHGTMLDTEDLWDSLCNVFASIDIDFSQDAFDARVQQVVSDLTRILDSVIDASITMDYTTIAKIDVIDYLICNYGFDDLQLRLFLDDIAEKTFNLKMDNDFFYSE